MITGNANMTREAVEYWVERLRQAEYALQLIAHHPIDTSLSAAAARQIAINYVNHNGAEPPAGDDDLCDCGCIEALRLHEERIGKER